MIRNIAMPTLTGSPRLPVNFDSSQRALPAVLLPSMHCAYVVNEMQGERL